MTEPALIAFSRFMQTIGWWLVPAVVVGSPFVLHPVLQDASGQGAHGSPGADDAGVRLALPQGQHHAVRPDASPCCSMRVSTYGQLHRPDRRRADDEPDPQGRPLVAASRSWRARTSARPSSRRRQFYPDVIAIISSGEETGKLPESLAHLADDYEEQVETMVKNLGQLVQPLLMIILGGIRGLYLHRGPHGLRPDADERSQEDRRRDPPPATEDPDRNPTINGDRTCPYEITFNRRFSQQSIWESFHAHWASSIAAQLNARFPKRFFAEVQTHLGSQVEADVVEFESLDESLDQSEKTPGNGAGGGVAVAVWAPPVATLTMPAVFPDDIEVHVRDELFDARVVAVVELVSPANKDRPEKRRAFAAKSAAYLQRGIGLITVDIVTDPALQPP